MNSESRGRNFPIAQKIYGALLRAYPAAHRAAYGGAMAQLFRDQCRDAWGESKNFGLLKLWLRVLPDLVSTSIMERLAALNERKTMSDKLGNLTGGQIPARKIFFRTFIPIFVLVFLYHLLAAFLLPDSFASTSQVLIKPKPDSPNIAAQYDPYLLQTQFEFIHSRAVLEPVVEQLNLNEVWGKKYFAGQTLKTSETVEILKNRMTLSPVKNTMIISMQVYSDDKNEAATLANEIADSYLKQTKNGQATILVQGSQVSGSLGLVIIEKATPGRYAVKPNRPLTVFMGFFFGLILAGAIGGVAFFITKLRRRNRAPDALVGS